jgi:hypothetical protein
MGERPEACGAAERLAEGDGGGLPIGRWETRVGVGRVGHGWATKAEWDG